MKDEELYRFLVIGGQDLWPYYAEVPFAAWPKVELEYDSYGDCQLPCDRKWSGLRVYDRAVGVTIVVLAAVLVAESNPRHRYMALAYSFPTDSHEPSQGRQVPLATVSPIPLQYCQPRYPLIFAQDPSGPQATALVADLFLRRLAGSAIWDGQYDDLLDRDRLLTRYRLGTDLVQSSSHLADEVRYWFDLGAGQLEDPRLHFWWKYADQVQYALQQPMTGLAQPPADAKGRAAWFWSSGYERGYYGFGPFTLGASGDENLEAYRTGYYAGQAQGEIDRGLTAAGEDQKL